MEMPLAAAKKTKQMQHRSSEFGFGQREFVLLRQQRTSFSYLQTDQEQEPRKYGQRAQNHEHCQKPDPLFVKGQDPFPAFMFAPHCVSISPPPAGATLASNALAQPAPTPRGRCASDSCSAIIRVGFI
jgi:hypothetical protein